MRVEVERGQGRTTLSGLRSGQVFRNELLKEDVVYYMLLGLREREHEDDGFFCRILNLRTDQVHAEGDKEVYPVKFKIVIGEAG